MKQLIVSVQVPRGVARRIRKQFHCVEASRPRACSRPSFSCAYQGHTRKNASQQWDAFRLTDCTNMEEMHLRARDRRQALNPSQASQQDGFIIEGPDVWLPAQASVIAVAARSGGEARAKSMTQRCNKQASLDMPGNRSSAMMRRWYRPP